MYLLYTAMVGAHVVHVLTDLTSLAYVSGILAVVALVFFFSRRQSSVSGDRFYFSFRGDVFIDLYGTILGQFAFFHDLHAFPFGHAVCFAVYQQCDRRRGIR